MKNSYLSGNAFFSGDKTT